jgi:hypothetical protein
MNGNPPKNSPNPFIGIQFVNCGTYTRIYRNKEKTMYTGFCPCCGTPVRVKIGTGENATNSRFFKYYSPCIKK